MLMYLYGNGYLKFLIKVVLLHKNGKIQYKFSLLCHFLHQKHRNKWNNEKMKVILSWDAFTLKKEK